MRGQKALLATTLVLLLLGAGAWGCGPAPTPTPPVDQVISCEEARAHIGEFKTVQGVFYASYRPDVRGEPTFLNCPVPYPNHDFTALIWGDERSVFQSCLGGAPEVVLDNREVRVSGLIEPYEGKPEIILTGCHQLEVIR